MGPFSTIFATSCGSIIISKSKVKKRKKCTEYVLKIPVGRNFQRRTANGKAVNGNKDTVKNVNTSHLLYHRSPSKQK